MASWNRVAAGAAAALALMAACPQAAMADVRGGDVLLGREMSSGAWEPSAGIDVSAPRAVMVDGDGRVVFERAADEPCRVASVTKVMTALLAARSSDMGEEVVVGPESSGIEGSTAGLRAGDRLSMGDLLLCMMLPSGNDAADAVARHVGRRLDPASPDPLATFVAAMNDEAARLGMSGTLYTNPHGLDVDGWDEGQHSTARDQATLVAEAMREPAVRDAAGRREADVAVTSADGSRRGLHLESTDRLLGRRRGAVGVKTGTTAAAGACFAGMEEAPDGGSAVTVVLGCGTPAEAFADTERLWDWRDAHSVSYGVAAGMEAAAMPDGSVAPVMGDAACVDWPDARVRAAMPDWTPLRTYDVLGEVARRVTLEPLSGRVSPGDPCGEVAFEQGGVEVGRRRLVAADGVAEPTPLQRVAIAVGRIRRRLAGEPLSARGTPRRPAEGGGDPAFADAGGRPSAAMSVREGTNRQPVTDIRVEPTGGR